MERFGSGAEGEGVEQGGRMRRAGQEEQRRGVRTEECEVA
jgi:hypothetical protein